MKLSKRTLNEIRKFEIYCYENSENLCKHFNSMDAYGFSINKHRVFFTTLQLDGSHWSRVMTIEEFNTLIDKLRESK